MRQFVPHRMSREMKLLNLRLRRECFLRCLYDRRLDHRGRCAHERARLYSANTRSFFEDYAIIRFAIYTIICARSKVFITNHPLLACTLNERATAENESKDSRCVYEAETRKAGPKNQILGVVFCKRPPLFAVVVVRRRSPTRKY